MRVLGEVCVSRTASALIPLSAQTLSAVGPTSNNKTVRL